MSGRRILMVDDDADALELLSAALRSEGYHVRAVPDARAAEASLTSFHPDLVLVDVELGDSVDGYTVARRLRAQSDVPLVFLTASSDVGAKVNGFNAGADDFVTKPFSFVELTARIEAVLRRAGRSSRKVLEVGDLVLDVDAHIVERAGSELELTAVEFALLEVLMRRAGCTLSKTQLLTDVWHFDHFDVNLVEVYISAVRKKLEKHGPRMIHTVRGVGYVLRA